MRIRMGRVQDYSLCLPLFSLLYHGDIGKDFKRAFECFVNSEGGVVLLSEWSNKVIGILVGSYQLDLDWEGRTAKIDALIIDEAHRKKGIGTELVQSFITMARSENCRAVKSRVNTKNVVAHKFHESLGFTKADTFEYFVECQKECE